MILNGVKFRKVYNTEFIGETDAEAQYIAHLMQIATSLEKPLMLGKIEDRMRRG